MIKKRQLEEELERLVLDSHLEITRVYGEIRDYLFDDDVSNEEKYYAAQIMTAEYLNKFNAINSLYLLKQGLKNIREGRRNEQNNQG